MTTPFTLPQSAKVAAAYQVAERLHQAGHTAWFAGGCVRDMLLGRPAYDIDIATSAHPDEVEALFSGQSVSIGKAFGIIVVICGGFSFDVATFRADGEYLDGRHPVQISLSTPEMDAQRRDLTINALFYDPVTTRIIDYVNGLADLTERRIRAVGNPATRFEEDHLRMLRAVRFASVLQFDMDPDTLNAIKSGANRITKVSVERVATEVTRLLCEAPQPSGGLNRLRETGLLRYILPEVMRLYGTTQPPQYHPEGDVWTHTCLMMDATSVPRTPLLAWSIMLHDIGKPATWREEKDPRSNTTLIRFPNHAPIGAELAESILKRLRQPTELVEQVKAVVAGHMHFIEAQQMRRAKLRRFMGQAIFPTLLEVMRVDTLHSNGDFTTWNFLKESFDSFKAEPILPAPLVQGRELMAWGVCQPGPQMGTLLRAVYDAQLEGSITTIAQAHAWLLDKTETGTQPES